MTPDSHSQSVTGRGSPVCQELTLEGEEGLQDRERRRHEGRGKRTQTLVRTGSGWHFLGVLSPLPRHPLLTNPVNLCMTQNHL